jgi:hypothetical protein
MMAAILQGKAKLKPKAWTYWDGIMVEQPENDIDSKRLELVITM